MSEYLTTHTQTATKLTFTPIASGVLQRQCACGQHTAGRSGECEECRQKRDSALQRAAVNPLPVREVPPIVHEVLRSPSQPFDAGARSFTGPRFGHDFSRVQASHAFSCLNRPQLPVLYDGAAELETGHTDCDWKRDVGPDEVFVPRSGKPKVTVSSTDNCTKPCTEIHEATHTTQLQPVCKAYHECYTQAPRQAAKSSECKDLTGEQRNKCIDLKTLEQRLECFLSLSEAWHARDWECKAYQESLACAEKLQQTAASACSGKLGAYIYSTRSKIKEYCKAEKSQSPEKSKESEKTPAK